MPYEVLNTPQLTIPSPPNLVSGSMGGSWGWSAWHEIAANSGASPLMLTAVVFRTTGSWIGGQAILEVGVGGAGAETPVVALRIIVAYFSQEGGMGVCSLALPANLIPANSRLSWRGAMDQATSIAVGLSVQETPDPLTIEVAPSATFDLRGRANALNTTWNTTDWGWSAYTQLSANVGVNDIAICGLWEEHGLLGGSSVPVEYQFAVGAAGSETPVTTYAESGGLTGQADAYLETVPWSNPLRVPAGSRLSVRGRKKGTNANGFNLSVSYWVLP